LGGFKAGVRILVFSDSCHSGTAIRAAYRAAAAASAPHSAPPRFMPAEVATRVYENNREFYDGILTKRLTPTRAGKIPASALLISGCQDNQTSADGPFNGRFTAAVKHVWRSGNFAGDYRKFWKAIVRLMPPDQTPNYRPEGVRNPAFEAQKPFAIAAK
jgi:hypothetical protein